MTTIPTEVQTWCIKISRKFIGCFLECFLLAFSFFFCFVVFSLTFSLSRFISNSPFRTPYNCHNDLNEDGEFEALCLHERRYYSINDPGILGEEELQELGVIIDVVKQRLSDLGIGNTRSSSSPSLSVSSTD